MAVEDAVERHANDERGIGRNNKMAHGQLRATPSCPAGLSGMTLSATMALPMIAGANPMTVGFKRRRRRG
jgi:hypothetical protein